LSIRSTKHVFPARGVHGGHSGRPGKLTAQPGSDDEKVLPSRYSDHPLREHDVFTLETPGGGFGDPFARDPGRVVSDVNEGYVSAERALADYGVAVTNSGGEWVLDDVGTRARRACGV
jgi:N-methylhydantoinase B/oxoprolinase/acetone carboxylase alpha subunit